MQQSLNGWTKIWAPDCSLVLWTIILTAKSSHTEQSCRAAFQVTSQQIWFTKYKELTVSYFTSINIHVRLCLSKFCASRKPAAIVSRLAFGTGRRMHKKKMEWGTWPETSGKGKTARARSISQKERIEGVIRISEKRWLLKANIS